MLARRPWCGMAAGNPARPVTAPTPALTINSLVPRAGNPSRRLANLSSGPGHSPGRTLASGLCRRLLWVAIFSCGLAAFFRPHCWECPFPSLQKCVSLYNQRQQGCLMHLGTATGFEPTRRATARRRCNQLRHRARYSGRRMHHY